MRTDILRNILPVAEKIGCGLSHLRVDFYLSSAGAKIGELTTYHMGGRATWHPPEWDEILGRIWAERARAS